MSYTSKNNWIQIERLQNLIAPRHAAGLKQTIELISPNRVLDLGCGTSNIALQILEDRNSIKSYTGVDIDKHALALAKCKHSAFRREYHQQMAQEYIAATREKFDLALCTSNTFAALGTTDDLKSLVSDLYRTSSTLILSIVPWDAKRIAYHKEFNEWVEIPEIEPGFKLMNEIIENDLFVFQTMKIECKNTIHSIKHQFLKFNTRQWERLFVNAGFQNISWLNPFNGDKIDPDKIPMPEFYILCEANL